MNLHFLDILHFLKKWATQKSFPSLARTTVLWELHRSFFIGKENSMCLKYFNGRKERYYVLPGLLVILKLWSSFPSFLVKILLWISIGVSCFLQGLKLLFCTCLRRICNLCILPSAYSLNAYVFYTVHVSFHEILRITEILVFKEFYRGAEHIENTQAISVERLVFFLNAKLVKQYLLYIFWSVNDIFSLKMSTIWCLSWKKFHFNDEN